MDYGDLGTKYGTSMMYHRFGCRLADSALFFDLHLELDLISPFIFPRTVPNAALIMLVYFVTKDKESCSTV